METEYARSRMMSSCGGVGKEEDDEDHLPGFRFHPTDEELVGFYLRRKVEKRPIQLDLIKLLDIYKFDPWDLPRKAGEREWYFFCRRGRKYKNSMRPNRVTRSGFWKATGIDRPIYSDQDCIGLKKSLVYYRGAAGKGTKTDWMMHEFRLPTALDKHIHHHPNTPLPQQQQPDAEVWTLCRILKRGVSYRKDWRETAKRNNPPAMVDASSSETCSVESADQDQNKSSSSSYISFRAPPIFKPSTQSQYHQLWSSSQSQSHQPPSSSSSYMYGDINELLRNADWEDLRSVVDSATNPNFYL